MVATPPVPLLLAAIAVFRVPPPEVLVSVTEPLMPVL